MKSLRISKFGSWYFCWEDNDFTSIDRVIYVTDNFSPS